MRGLLFVGIALVVGVLFIAGKSSSSSSESTLQVFTKHYGQPTATHDWTAPSGRIYKVYEWNLNQPDIKGMVVAVTGPNTDANFVVDPTGHVTPPDKTKLDATAQTDLAQLISMFVAKAGEL